MWVARVPDFDNTTNLVSRGGRTPCGWRECPKKATAEDKLLTSRTPCGWRECPKTSSSSHIGLPLSHPMWVARVPDDKEAAYGAVSYTHLDVYKRQPFGGAWGGAP